MFLQLFITEDATQDGKLLSEIPSVFIMKTKLSNLMRHHIGLVIDLN